MPHFFIDTADGDGHHRDEEGYDIRDAQAARRMAITALTDMATEALPEGQERSLAATIRDARGTTLLLATLHQTAKWV